MRHLLLKYTECLSSVFYQQGLYELLLDQEIQQSKVASVLSAKSRVQKLHLRRQINLPDAQWEVGAAVKTAGQYQEN